jgi:hypothetical protein
MGARRNRCAADDVRGQLAVDFRLSRGDTVQVIPLSRHVNHRERLVGSAQMPAERMVRRHVTAVVLGARERVRAQARESEIDQDGLDMEGVTGLAVAGQAALDISAT